MTVEEWLALWAMALGLVLIVAGLLIGAGG